MSEAYVFPPVLSEKQLTVMVLRKGCIIPMVETVRDEFRDGQAGAQA